MPCDILLLHFIWIVCNKVVYLQRLSLRTILNFSRASGGFSEVPDLFFLYRSPKKSTLFYYAISPLKDILFVNTLCYTHISKKETDYSCRIIQRQQHLCPHLILLFVDRKQCLENITLG